MMRTIVKSMMSGLMALALVMVSCQKEEAENDLFIENDQEEGFMSKTNNSDSEIEISSEVLTPLLHRRYDASLSKEEASALFHAEVDKFAKENGHANRTASYFNFEVWTRTSNYAYSQTDANVWARFYFLTDQGNKNLPWARLNNAGDDRQNGAWDFYYFGSHASSINWLEARGAQVALQGTDGWHVKYFDIRVWGHKQYSSATGNSRVLSNPEIWLDNATSTGWDYYHTGYVGTGRTNFN
ncbi:MAG: hypothetical protein ACR2MT_05880 [Aurantibacter sp.]